MSSRDKSIWFWMRICTPHMAALAKDLAERGYNVTYVANALLSENRAQQGWEKPDLGKVNFKLVENKDEVLCLALKVEEDSIHLCQGLRANGLVGDAQKILRKRGLRQWVFMEIVDDAGWLGLVKQVVYRILFFHWRDHLSGVLAIGNRATDWFIERGMKKNRIYPFAYFLNNPQKDTLYQLSDKSDTKRPYRFIFVGSLIKLKKVDQLINSIATLKLKEVELWIIGNGSEKDNLSLLADSLLPNQVRWFGTVRISDVPNMISQADCLVLPSRYDGWGAVISEALMVGTPVICSNACGASDVVRASGVGGVFNVNDQSSLINILQNQFETGHWSDNQRHLVSKWAKCLDSESGAEYLELILDNVNQELITVPWIKRNKIL